MNFQQLLYVIEVDRCKSISHASRNLFVSQPCISSAIKDLEDSLRITIFTRSNSGVKTTELGEAFIRDAKEVIRQAEMLDQKYGQVHNDPAYHFWVAAYPKDSVTHAAIDLVEQCVASSKGLDLNIYGASMSQAIEDVRLKRADVGIVSFYSMFNHVSRQWVMDNELEFHKLSDFSIRIAVEFYFPPSASISRRVRQPKSAHLARAGMWATSASAAASSSAASCSSPALPSIMSKNASASESASARVFPITRSIIISAEAWDTAQPLPLKDASSMTPSGETRSCRFMSSPQLGLTPSWAEQGCSRSHL
jgi:DNA-binding transcriptional LysR family regulator